MRVLTKFEVCDPGSFLEPMTSTMSVQCTVVMAQMQLKTTGSFQVHMRLLLKGALASPEFGQ